MGQKSWSKWLKVVVLGVGVADLVGIYIANQKLNQPVEQDSEDDSFILAGLDTPASAQADRASLEDGIKLPAPVREVEAPAVTLSAKQLAEIDLPLPAYGASLAEVKSEPRDAVPSVSLRPSDRQLARLARGERRPASNRGFSSAFADGVADDSRLETDHAAESTAEQAEPEVAAYAEAFAEAPQAVDQSSPSEGTAPAEPMAELPPLPADTDSSQPAL